MSHFKELLIKHGAPPPNPKPKPKEKPKGPPAAPVKKVNERQIQKEFVLQIFDGQQYRPISQEEF